MSRFEKLARRIAQVQDADREALRATERNAGSFIQTLRRKQRRRPFPLLWAASLLLAAAIPFLVWMIVLGEDRPPVRSPLAKAHVERGIVVPRDQTIPVHFSDGSQLVLTASTRATVRELSRQETHIDLEGGRAQFSVIHRAETRWTISAGPYQVRVTGTKFALEWSPAGDRFALELAEGSVLVSTHDSSHSAVRMVAPEHLVIDHGVWQLSPLRNDTAEPSAATPAQPRVTQRSRAPRTPPKPAAPLVAGPTPDTRPPVDDWQTLGKQGKFAEAYSQAEVLGIERWSQTASPAELLALAEICRFSGHPSQGRSVLTTLRERFPEREESAIAAFQLGRLFGDGQPAVKWFRTYLRERPRGSLAREAAGRLLEVLDRSGDQVSATAAAESYLRSYPSGPHAPFARQVLGH